MNNTKPVILCIDDDPDFLESLVIILESGNFVVRTAANAHEGLKQYRLQRPDLILVDLMMEEVDAGINFVRDIRAVGPTPPIFLLSSVGDNLNMNTDYTQLGLSGVFQKPIKPDVLLATLRAKLKS